MEKREQLNGRDVEVFRTWKYYREGETEESSCSFCTMQLGPDHRPAPFNWDIVFLAEAASRNEGGKALGGVGRLTSG